MLNSPESSLTMQSLAGRSNGFTLHPDLRDPSGEGSPSQLRQPLRQEGMERPEALLVKDSYQDCRDVPSGKQQPSSYAGFQAAKPSLIIFLAKRADGEDDKKDSQPRDTGYSK
nr:hypothetical protein CFP56_52225 [Quercus suber]